MTHYIAQSEIGIFENINYKGTTTAAWEVTIMLLGAYLLGVLTYWLIHRYLHSYAERTLLTSALHESEMMTEDDLTIIEGVGPKIATILQKNNIKTYRTLAITKPKDIKKILAAAGTRFAIHDPTSWPKQARLAAAGQFDELEELENKLIAGK